MNKELFVQNIKNFCKAKGVKPTVACRESGVGTSFINDINRGQTPSVAKVQLLADYLGVTTSELLGEPLPTGEAMEKAQLQAAFWGGEKDLTQEEKDAMWADVEKYAAFLAEQKRRERGSGAKTS